MCYLVDRYRYEFEEFFPSECVNGCGNFTFRRNYCIRTYGKNIHQSGCYVQHAHCADGSFAPLSLSTLVKLFLSCSLAHFSLTYNGIMYNKNGQNSGLVSSCTPKSTKRNLSSSSLSLHPNDKKSKRFVSPNRFAVLVSEENNLSKPNVICDAFYAINESIIPAIHDNSRASLFYIQNIKNFSTYKNTLKVTGQNSFIYKSLPSFLIVLPQGREHFNIIAEYLMETDASFYTFMPSIYRPYKIVIRNLHHSTLTSDISDALDELGHSATCVVNVIKNRRPLPLFFVNLTPNTNNKEVLSISSILHTKMKVKLPYRTKSGPPQCKNCQTYGHTTKYFHHPSRCVKCGRSHSLDTCAKEKSSSATCVLCAGYHTSNYKGCPKYKTLL
jgi:predicted Zn-ribbon and HTH transcriptional regulator